MVHSPNSGLKLSHCLRRWLSIKAALGRCHEFAPSALVYHEAKRQYLLTFDTDTFDIALRQYVNVARQTRRWPNSNPTLGQRLVFAGWQRDQVSPV